MELKQNSKLNARKRKSWSPMQLKFLGTVTDLIKGGGGKLNLRGGDPGAGRKQKSG